MRMVSGAKRDHPAGETLVVADDDVCLCGMKK